MGMSDETKQSGVDWLVEELLNGKALMPSIIQQAKEMEKKQIEDAELRSKEIAIPFKILYDMIYFIEESTTDINEQFGGCTNLEKLIESNEMPELYYKLVELQRNIRR